MNIINKILVELSSSILISEKIRQKALNNRIGTVKTATIRGRCIFFGNQINIGKNSFINHNCKFYSHYNIPESCINIGNNVFLGMDVLITTHTHNISSREQRASNDTVFKPVTIGDGTWIGANVTIIPGITIGSGCVIAAGSVVIRDCEDNCLYAGNPAKKIKELPIEI